MTPEGWVNVDYSAGARIMKIFPLRLLNRRLHFFNVDWSDEITIHDLRKPFPWPDNSVDVVYSSHTLEHLSRDAGRLFLEECMRVLKKDGIIRIIVPDLKALVSEYMSGGIPADEFVLRMEVLTGKGDEGFFGKLRSALISFPHKCMYDEKCLAGILCDMGFQASVRKSMESDIEGIGEIEREDRTVNAVVVEGRKS